MFTKKSTIRENSKPVEPVKITHFRVNAFDEEGHTIVFAEPLLELEKAITLCSNLFPLISCNLQVVQVTETKGSEDLEYEKIAAFVHSFKEWK